MGTRYVLIGRTHPDRPDKSRGRCRRGTQAAGCHQARSTRRAWQAGHARMGQDEPGYGARRAAGARIRQCESFKQGLRQEERGRSRSSPDRNGRRLGRQSGQAKRPISASRPRGMTARPSTGCTFAVTCPWTVSGRSAATTPAGYFVEEPVQRLFGQQHHRRRRARTARSTSSSGLRRQDCKLPADRGRAGTTRSASTGHTKPFSTEAGNSRLRSRWIERQQCRRLERPLPQPVTDGCVFATIGNFNGPTAELLMPGC